MRKPCFASALLCFLLAITSSPILANNAPSYIERFKEIAITEMHRSGVPASITLAQAIHESGWGNGTLATNSNNYFGIKCKDYWNGPTYYIKDDDYKDGELIKSCFRAYEKIEDSFKDHSDFLRDNPRYRILFQKAITDYKGWAEGLQSCGYATDKAYATKLIANIEKYKLYEFDTAPNPVDQVPQIAITKPRPSTTPATTAPSFNLGDYVSANPEPASPTAPSTTTIQPAAPVVEAPATPQIPVYDFAEENYEVPAAYALPDDYVRGENREEVPVLNLSTTIEVENTTTAIEVEASPQAPQQVAEVEAVYEEVSQTPAFAQHYSVPSPAPRPIVPSPAPEESTAIISMSYTGNKKTTQLSRQPRVNNSRRR